MARPNGRPSRAPDALTVDEADVLELFERCSNVGRWGPDDARGTLNLITADVRRRAAGLVRTGRVVPLAKTLNTMADRANRTPVRHRMLEGGEPGAVGSADEAAIAPHGYSVTHLDAFGHAFFNGRAFNGRTVDETWTPNGLRHGAIDALREGIFTRAILLDVARFRGVPWLAPGDGVSAADLDGAEQAAGVRVGAGDAVLVRVGLAAREAVEGPEDPTHRAGLLPECIPWLFDRDVAVYGGDCIERLPSPYPTVPAPFHMVALVSMGLVLLDNPEVDDLAVAVAEEERAEFLLTCAPLPLPGGTGSPVNPLALF